jgi:hypothetical protein
MNASPVKNREARYFLGVFDKRRRSTGCWNWHSLKIQQTNSTGSEVKALLDRGHVAFLSHSSLEQTLDRLHDVKRIGHGREDGGQQIVGIERDWRKHLPETGGREMRSRLGLWRCGTFSLRRGRGGRRPGRTPRSPPSPGSWLDVSFQEVVHSV